MKNHLFDITYDTVYDTSVIKAVLDTNVIVAAMKSSSGASHELLLRAGDGTFEMALSVPLLTEYQDVTSRPGMEIPISRQAVESIIDWICRISVNQRIHFLWRPYLPDPKDDMVFETALAAGASHIVTFNTKDFHKVKELGVTPVLPSEFLKLIS